MTKMMVREFLPVKSAVEKNLMVRTTLESGGSITKIL